jgi:murein DD-endopeptidase MepM/ murein hydrolase activator NlpD
MDIIVVSPLRGRSWQFRLGGVPSALFGVAVCALAAGLVLIGYSLQPRAAALPRDLLNNWANEIRGQHQHLLTLRGQMQDNSEALSRRLAELQAHVMRLDAAGGRLTQLAGLDQAEFNFDQKPPLGGPENDLAGPSLTVEASLALLDQFETQLGERERRLRVLEDLLLASRLQKNVQPSGWPIEAGWISSVFGLRTDPFNGRRAFHAGIDFAGSTGSGVLAVAPGIITDVGDRIGYGKLVEINHGNGYSTRYGHNSRVLVKAGDQVRRGERIALMGETGRATGPHVHFEVVLNGKVVDPAQYIQAAH